MLNQKTPRRAEIRPLAAAGVALLCTLTACGTPDKPVSRSARETPFIDATSHACPGQEMLPNREFAYAADVPPQRIEYAPPAYSNEPAKQNLRGIVIVGAVLDAAGTVRQTKVMQSVSALDDAAADAVCRWRFTPARLGGRPIAVAMTITVEFPPRRE
jgi:TonB family protein